MNILRAYKKFFVVFGIVSMGIMYLFYQALKPKETLPVYQPTMIDQSLMDSTVQYVKKYHRIADFNLINQNGDSISQKDYKDKIYVADFFFTTCPTICPIMTDNMLLLQEALLEDDQVLLLSHSVTPKIDSVPQLKKYALEKGVIDSKWNLVTGDKKAIYELARKSYLVAKDDGDGGPFDMIHTENFVLVDQKKRIRGFYDGTNREEIDELLRDIEILKSLSTEND